MLAAGCAAAVAAFACGHGRGTNECHNAAGAFCSPTSDDIDAQASQSGQEDDADNPSFGDTFADRRSPDADARPDARAVRDADAGQ
jgi:hypothetical protein